MNNIPLIILIFLTISCNSVYNEKNDTDKSLASWIQKDNDRTMAGMEFTLENFNNDEGNLKLLKSAQRYSTFIRQELYSTNDNEKLLAKLRKSLDTINLQNKDWLSYLSIPSKHNKLIQLSLVEKEVISHYSSKMYFEEPSFDSLHLLFVPNEIKIRKGERLNGKVYFVATSSSFSDFSEITLDESPLKMHTSYGIVDTDKIPLNRELNFEIISNKKAYSFNQIVNVHVE